MEYKSAEEFARAINIKTYSRLSKLGYANEGYELFDENRFFARLARELKTTRDNVTSLFPIKRREPQIGTIGLMIPPTKQDLIDFYTDFYNQAIILERIIWSWKQKFAKKVMETGSIYIVDDAEEKLAQEILNAGYHKHKKVGGK